MRAFYVTNQQNPLHVLATISDEYDHPLYQLTTDSLRHSWMLKTYKKGYTLFVFEHGFTLSSIKFCYLNHVYTVKKSMWNSQYIVCSATDQSHRFKFSNGSYKSHFYIDGVEQSYFDEDAQVISTNENQAVFLLLVHLAVYIIMLNNNLLTKENG